MSTTSRRLRRALPVCLAATVLGGALTLPTGDALAGGGDHGPQSVILIIGDGMGAAHREAARLDQTGFDGRLAMDSLPVAGLETTDPRDPTATITDSAAAASAWATGQKTFNGAISVDVDSRPLRTLGQEAKRNGRSTGLVTTAQVTDASPAAFYANTPTRSQQSEIARQYLEVSQPDVILGGGEDFWYPAGTPGAYPDAPADDPTEASRGDRGNLVQRAQQLGYQYVTTAGQLRNARGGKVLGLFANQEMFQQRPEGAGDEYDPVVPLADMTRSALGVLDRDRDGFFLVVEEEAVDEMSHNNNAPRMLQAMRSLDDTVKVARQYVAKHPGTLLIVTGDHECGGLTVEDVDAADESGTTSLEDGPFAVARSTKRFVIDWTTTGHTGVPTPVTAEGFRADRLTGTYPNTYLYTVMRSALLGR